jgi:hypothetical protein
MTTHIDGFDNTEDTPAPQKEELEVEISYEGFVRQLQGRMAQVFTELMTENAQIRAQAQQLVHDRDAACAERDAAKKALEDFMLAMKP